MAQPHIHRTPPFYHIHHVDNLASIGRAGKLWSDAERLRQGLVRRTWLQHIKERKVKAGPCLCGKRQARRYVPFYFGNRSIMLYVIKPGHEDYNDGQRT